MKCVTYGQEGDWRRWGGGMGGFQMVMVKTSIHSEFPATVPCLSPPDYFLVQGLLHFKVFSLPMSVIWSCQGAYISAQIHTKNHQQN